MMLQATMGRGNSILRSVWPESRVIFFSSTTAWTVLLLFSPSSVSSVDLGDAVAAAELHHLGAGGELGVHLQAAKLQVGEADLGVVADEAGVGLEVVASEV